MAFNLYTYDTLDDLFECYFQIRKDAPEEFYNTKDLFVPEEVTVPTNGMEIWLRQQLNQRGCPLVNYRVRYLQNRINDILDKDAPYKAALNYHPKKFSTACMTWRIFKLLQGSLPEDYHVISRYLSGVAQASPCRSFFLAEQIAQVFDQYTANEPEMLSAWADGEEIVAGDRVRGRAATGALPKEQIWQQRLWYALCHDENGNRLHSPADLITAFNRADTSELPQNLPPLTLFGISTMFPAYLNFFRKLGDIGTVHFFYMNPCDEYWADVYKVRHAYPSEEEYDADISKSLLVNYGQLGRHFFKSVLELEGIHETDRENNLVPSRETASASLLNAIQQSIHKLENRENYVLSPEDDSLTVHKCYSDLRQVEVLHDHLLALLQRSNQGEAKDTRLKLNDIIVMSPDLQRFAPLIRQVFDSGPLKDKYAICDRSLKQANHLASAFLDILGITSHRFELSFVMHLLDTQELRERFALDESDVDLIRLMAANTHVCWGKDGEHQQNYGFRDFINFSWQQGVDRMLLGMAIQNEDSMDGTWMNLVPYSKLDDTNNHRILSSFLDYFSALRRYEALLSTRRGMAEWRELLHNMMEDFFIPNYDKGSYFRTLLDAVNMMAAAAIEAGYDGDVDIAVIQGCLSSATECAMDSQPFLSGAITFCAMTPMRGIPCKVLAMLGMEEGAFPRSNTKVGFNIIAEQIERTYRSREMEDRYLFLEALLAARENLMIYYTAYDAVKDTVKDNGKHTHELPPAIPVSELQSYIQFIMGDAEMSKATTVSHTLVPYDRGNFIQSQLNLRQRFSYSKINRNLVCADNGLSRQLEAAQRDSFRQMNIQLDEGLATPLCVSVKELVGYLASPTETYLQNVFNLPKSPYTETSLGDTELCSLAKPASLLKTKLAPWMLEEADCFLSEEEKAAEICVSPSNLDLFSKRVRQRLDAESALPLGAAGDTTMKDLLDKAWIPQKKYRDAWLVQRSAQTTMGISLDFCNEIRCPVPEPEDDFLRLAHKVIPNVSSEAASEEAGAESAAAGEGSGATAFYSQITLVGNCPSALTDGGVFVIPSFNGKVSYRDSIEAWVYHLLLNAGKKSDDVSVETAILLGGGGVRSFASIGKEQAKEQLKKVLEVYLYGKKHALPLFSSLVDEKYEKKLQSISKKIQFFGCKTRYAKGEQLLWWKDQEDLQNQQEENSAATEDMLDLSWTLGSCLYKGVAEARTEIKAETGEKKKAKKKK